LSITPTVVPSKRTLNLVFASQTGFNLRDRIRQDQPQFPDLDSLLTTNGTGNPSSSRILLRTASLASTASRTIGSHAFSLATELREVLSVPMHRNPLRLFTWHARSESDYGWLVSATKSHCATIKSANCNLGFWEHSLELRSLGFGAFYLGCPTHFSQPVPILSNRLLMRRVSGFSEGAFFKANQRLTVGVVEGGSGRFSVQPGLAVPFVSESFRW